MKNNHIHHKIYGPIYGPDRWTYYQDASMGNVPELIMLGFDHIRQAVSLAEHQHPGSYEFVFIQKGKVSWEIEGVAYETRAGDVFHTKPDEVHSGNLNIVEPCQLFWFVLKAPNLQQGWLRLAPEEIRAMDQKLNQLPRIVHTGIKLADEFQKMRETVTGADHLRTITVRSCIVDILLAILRPKNTSAIADDILVKLQMLAEHIAKYPEWRPSIEQLASRIEVSPSHFYRIFQEYTGLTPMSYLERSRIEIACRRLKESDISITRLAHDLGYQSSQHFATVFKRFTGSTPTSWWSGS